LAELHSAIATTRESQEPFDAPIVTAGELQISKNLLRKCIKRLKPDDPDKNRFKAALRLFTVLWTRYNKVYC